MIGTNLNRGWTTSPFFNMKKTATALALDAVEKGMSIAKAAEKFGIVRQSIYRLRSYRGAKRQCPTCGSLVNENKLMK